MLYLASSSPRRQELLKLLVPDFRIEIPSFDEEPYQDIFKPERLSMEEARLKAFSIFAKHPNDEVLAADTIVVIDHEALGKPHDFERALTMFKRINGRVHHVLTSYTYLSQKEEITRTVVSKVKIKNWSEEEILFYLKKCQPFDKAGSYGIQDNPSPVKEIAGSYFNVMGLPLEDLALHVFHSSFEEPNIIL